MFSPIVGKMGSTIGIKDILKGKDEYGKDEKFFGAGEKQWWCNLMTLFITLGCAIVGGLLVGGLIKLFEKKGWVRGLEYYADDGENFCHVPLEVHDRTAQANKENTPPKPSQ